MSKSNTRGRHRLIACTCGLMVVGCAVVSHPAARAARIPQRLVYNLATGRIGALPARLHVAATATPYGCPHLRVSVAHLVGTRPTILKEWFLQVGGGSPRLHLSDRVAYDTSRVVAGTEGHPGTPWAAMIFTSPTGQIVVTRAGRQTRVTYPVLYSLADVYRRHEGFSAGCSGLMRLIAYLTRRPAPSLLDALTPPHG